MASSEESQTVLRISLDSIEFLRRIENVSEQFFQLQRQTNEILTDSTQLQRHFAIGSVVHCYESLEIFFYRIQQEGSANTAELDRIFAKIKSIGVSGSRRMTPEEQLDEARRILLHKSLVTDIESFYISRNWCLTDQQICLMSFLISSLTQNYEVRRSQV